MPPRRTPLAPGQPPRGRKTRLKKSGETKRKKRARYEAYLRSPEWKAKRKACLERAGRRCECGVQVRYFPDLIAWERCPEGATQVHHRTYARFGHELPEDLTACCKPHHDAMEAELRPWNKNRRSA